MWDSETGKLERLTTCRAGAGVSIPLAEGTAHALVVRQADTRAGVGQLRLNPGYLRLLAQQLAVGLANLPDLKFVVGVGVAVVHKRCSQMEVRRALGAAVVE